MRFQTIPTRPRRLLEMVWFWTAPIDNRKSRRRCGGRTTTDHRHGWHPRSVREFAIRTKAGGRCQTQRQEPLQSTLKPSQLHQRGGCFSYPPLIYLQALSLFGSGVCSLDNFHSIFNRRVMSIVRVLADPANPVTPTFSVTHSTPGLEQMDMNDLGPAKL